MVAPIVFFFPSPLPWLSEEDGVSKKEKITNRVVSLAKACHLSDHGQECN